MTKLSVGATTIQAGKSGYQANPEEAVYEQFVGSAYPYTSGSGFSNIFDRPDYQNVAVKTYFQTADPGWPYYSTTNGKDIGKNGGLYNRAGRGELSCITMSMDMLTWS
jgi:tripeptidyl-peptidase-1